jgi:hypothetical protein
MYQYKKIGEKMSNFSANLVIAHNFDIFFRVVTTNFRHHSFVIHYKDKTARRELKYKTEGQKDD